MLMFLWQHPCPLRHFCVWVIPMMVLSFLSFRRLALSVIAPQCHLSQRERLWLTVKFSIIITKWAAHCNEWTAR